LLRVTRVDRSPFPVPDMSIIAKKDAEMIFQFKIQ
jgi:hypothetical protein